MALTPFDMEGVNRDLLAAGNPAKPDMQSILRRNARDLVLGNAILVSSVDAKELEFGVHMAYSDADGGFDTDPSEDVWFEASSLPIPNERPDLPPDNALRIRVTDVLTEYGFTDIDVKAPDRTPEGIWIGFEAMQPVRLDATMEPLDKRLYAAAEKEFKERALDPDGECYQLDGGTFISQESFDGICGDQRDRYMAWKNQAEPARLVSAWDDPARLDRLVGDLIDADDGGGCFYTDAQPIDYTQGMDYSPQQLAADSGLGDTVPLACESNASYSLAHHPDIKFTATGSPDGRKALEVSAPGSARHALITAKPGTFDVSLHDERGIVSGESFPYEANDSWTYRLSGQALRGALDLAVGWADPQETSPETAGLGLALDDGMETTHGR